MKYAHLADLHLGSWRDPKMRDLSTTAFLQAIDNCIAEQLDFILFAGDIFNTSLPSLDTLKIVTKKLKELKDKNIPLYVIAGSHDFSPTGKTMVDVLENAGLLHNVCKGKINPETKELHLTFFTDPKTGAKITGVVGRKGMLDQAYYENLHRTSLEYEPGYKIFMFHTAVTELMPSELAIVETIPLSTFPKGFNYYAGGHIHHPAKVELPEQGYACATYPGALFPNNFQEVEKYHHGGYNLITVEDHNNENNTTKTKQTITWIPLKVIEHSTLILDCHKKSPEVITFEILDFFRDKNIQNHLLTIRLQGTLQSGKVADIRFKEIIETLYKQGAYFVMKNTTKLTSEELEEIKIAYTNPETIEAETIKEHLQQSTTFDRQTELHLITSLLTSLHTIKAEGETNTDFEQRVKSEIANLLQLELE